MSSKPNPVDQYVGMRVRQLRLERKLTQKQLGDQLGRTFQQVQKYENGTNRISASVLFRISVIFDVPIMYFFSGLSGHSEPNTVDQSSINVQSLMSTREGLRLVKAFGKLNDAKIRKKILELVEGIAETEI